ncbi:MAG: site-specific DNA-methyltransferase [Desulfobacula sp.]|jgi:DNA modification methylase|nr:site-specific DNA-methyltransferase [Desulfobacula sp.]
MKTEHKTIFADSRRMQGLSDESVDLMVTSPPYPMIEMWDDLFSLQSSLVKKQLKKGDGSGAFESMHKILDATWKEAYRVLKPGGFACINIGDATRSINGNFALYTNHARILKFTQELGFSSLPCILWRKQTNAPNKFMGSGMLPAGAYVTLEHEYILILRKGSKREFKQEADKKNRRASALFWEERNLWFSDIWFDIKGSQQALNDKDTRKRSAAYPFELAYRLINMYSVKGDLVLDPYLGMGTTTSAAIASGRNSVGYEIENTLQDANSRSKNAIIEISQQIISQRLVNHLAFVFQRIKSKGKLKYDNVHYGFPIMTAQEKELLINEPLNIKTIEENLSIVDYSLVAQKEFCKDWSKIYQEEKKNFIIENLKDQVLGKNFKQKSLF